MSRFRLAAIAVGGVALLALVHRAQRGATGRSAPGGVLIADAAAYDAVSRLVAGSFFGPIAADIAAIAPLGGRILEVGCGPGHLSIRLARDHRLDVTGLDLDPAMIERAGANAGRIIETEIDRPAFIVGDVAALPFADGSFDLVVSTFSMHHWSDPTSGLTEIARVLRPAGRALVWDFRPGFRLFHASAPDPLGPVHGSPLRVLSARPWRWPWRLTLSQRLELARDD
jgi:SAM-dependent methyltransferase